MSWCAAVMLAAAPLQVAHGQLGFESLFKDINNISFFFSCWTIRGELRHESQCPSERNGYGVEVSYSVGALSLWGDTIRTRPGWDTTKRTVECAGTNCTSASNVTTSIELAWRKGAKRTRYQLGVDFGLSYSQFSGFSSADTTLIISGAIREIPGATVYFSLFASGDSIRDPSGAARGPPPLGARILQWVQPYVGVRSGLLQLTAVQGFERPSADTLRAYTASGTAFQLGLAAGVFLSLPDDRAGVFVEWDRTIRRFANPQWATSGTSLIPARLPRPFDLTGSALYIGLQAKIRDPAR